MSKKNEENRRKKYRYLRSIGKFGSKDANTLKERSWKNVIAASKLNLEFNKQMKELEEERKQLLDEVKGKKQ